jgi:hypothetical protein
MPMIRQEINTLPFIDLSSLKQSGDLKPSVPDRLYYHPYGYDEWQTAELFLPVNEFITAQPDADQVLLGQFYLSVWQTLNFLTWDDYIARSNLYTNAEGTMHQLTLQLVDTCSTLAKMTLQFANDFDLINRLRCSSEYVICQHDIHHSTRQGQTFTHDDCVEVITLSLLSKLFAPIWGELVYRLNGLIDNRDECCLAMINPLLEQSSLREISHKLRTYINEICNAAMAQIPTEMAKSTAPDAGFPLERIQNSVFTTTIVKHCTDADLYAPGGNILEWLSVGIKQSFSTIMLRIT